MSLCGVDANNISGDVGAGICKLSSEIGISPFLGGGAIGIPRFLSVGSGSEVCDIADDAIVRSHMVDPGKAG